MFLLKHTATTSYLLSKKSIGTSILKRQLIKWSSFFSVSILLLFASPAQAQPCLVPISGNSIDIQPATCAGTVATLKGSIPLGGNGTYVYQWQKSIGNCGAGNFLPIVGATARDYAVPPAADPNDCFRRVVTSGTCTDISNTTKVALTDRTTPAPPTTVAVQPTCIAGTGTITVSSPAPAAGIFYSIDGISYTNTTGIFTGLGPATYSVTAKYPAGCISPVKTETINNLPVVAGTISPAAATFCVGGSQVLTVTGGTSYQWYKNGTAIAGATASTYTATTAGTYTANIIIGICIGNSSNSATVTVTSLPTGTISPSTLTICEGSSAALTVTGGTSYQWFKNGVAISGATAASYNASSDGTYTADIIAGTCRNAASNSAVVSLVPVPTGSITPSSASICTGTNQVLTASGGGTYKWYKDGVIINGATAATYTASQPGSYSVTISNGSCSRDASNVAIITQRVSPSGLITPASASICPGGIVPLTAVTASGGSTYQWSFNSVSISGATGAVYNAAQPGTYSVILFNGNCSGVALNVATINVSAPVTFTPAATNPSCTSSTGSITVNGVSGGGSSNYLYSRDNGVTYQTANTFANLTAGTYQVVVKDTAGCISNPKPVIIQSFTSTLSASASTTNVTCGQTSGSVTITSGGGIAPYLYSLDNGAYGASNFFNNVIPGNHKVTVKDAAGCTRDVLFVISQTSFNPTLVITNPPNICPGFTANLLASTITAGSDTALLYTYWKDTMASTPLANPGTVTAGTYYIKATNTTGCYTIKPVTITLFTVTAGSITPAAPPLTCSGSAVTLTASSGTAYQWYRNDTIINGANSGIYNAVSGGIYSVFISNGTCNVLASNKVSAKFQACLPKIFVPTAFTPNKNGTNDVLRPLLYNVAELRYFKVYNRWGQQVFETATQGKGWDGAIQGAQQPAETYSWILECTGLNGETIKQSGRSLLIR